LFGATSPAQGEEPGGYFFVVFLVVFLVAFLPPFFAAFFIAMALVTSFL
jgi:hypothetical protein